jgi:hypothetical protein
MNINVDSNQDEKKEILTELMGFEVSKLKNTIRDLTFKPGIAIDEYSQGERKKYLSPITYFLLVFGLSFFIDSVSGIGDYLFQKGFGPGQNIGESFSSGIKKAETDSGEKMPFDIASVSKKIDTEAQAFYERKEVQMLILVPGLLLSQWLFFRRTKKSFLHNSYFALYTLAHYTLLLMPLALLFFVSEKLFYYTYLTLGLVVPIAYNIYSGVNYYSTDWRNLILKNILLFITIAIIASLISGLLGIMIGLYATIVHMKGG